MKAISSHQGGLYSIALYVLFCFFCSIGLPLISEIDRLVIILYSLFGPPLFIYGGVKMIFIPPYSDQDFLSIDEGIIFLISPFLTILCCYFLGFYIIKLYNHLKK